MEQAGSELFNRIMKNRKKLASWLKTSGVSCYRVYDRDLPDYAFSADVYEDQLHVQEYARPKDLPEEKADARMKLAVEALALAFEVPERNIHLKRRVIAKGGSKYARPENPSLFFRAREDGLTFLVNMAGHHDVGLFLDHRPVRAWIRRNSKGASFLNLFCYTASATVHAIAGGAARTLSVDLSNTYLDWGRKNLLANGLTGDSHEFLREDILSWLPRCTAKFSLIFVDPPTYSNSKSMGSDWDVQRDHDVLLLGCRRLLADGGSVLFSTNSREFELNDGLSRFFEITDLSAKLLDPDFQRNPKIHQVFLMKKGQG